MVVLFGGNASSVALHDTWTLSGSTWLSHDVAAPAARSHHAMVRDPSRDLAVLFGGKDATDAALDDTWVWQGTS